MSYKGSLNFYYYFTTTGTILLDSDKDRIHTPAE